MNFRNIYLFFILYSIFSLTVYSKSTYTKPDTVLIKEYYLKASDFDMLKRNNYDSALYYLNKALIISQDLKYDEYIIPIYRSYAHLLNESGNYSLSLEFYLKLLEELETRAVHDKNIDITKEYVNIYVPIGLIYFNLNDTDKALFYFEQALEMAQKAYEEDEEYDINAVCMVIYADIGSVYLVNGNYEIARTNFENALNYDEKTHDEIVRAKIYNNLGIVNKELYNYDTAFEYYDKAMEIYILKKDSSNMAQVYNNIAICHYFTNNSKKAIEILEKTIQLSQQSSNLKTEKLATNSLAYMLFEKKDYYNSLMLTRRELELRQNLLSQESAERIEQIENRYQYEKVVKQERLEQQVLLAQKEKNILISVMIAVILFFICLVLFLFYRNSKTKIREQKLKSQNLELEKQNLELKNAELGKDIENKNKELTTHVMYLSQKNAFMGTIMEQLTELAAEPKQITRQKVNNIIRQIKANVDNNSWEEFEIRFQQVHQDFYTKLNELIPNLTPNEKRLCAFLRLNMTTKEIASLTFQTLKSIHVARTRLRKKMNIERDENLISILQNL